MTFPGIIEPGSFSGKESSPRPLLGPEAKKRISLAIFIQDTAIVFRQPWNSTKVSWQARDSNLLGEVLNSTSLIIIPFNFAKFYKSLFNSIEIYLAISTSKPLNVFKPVPTAVPP